MSIHDLLVFFQKWSPHIWLFGSIFGVLLSGTLYFRARTIVVENEALVRTARFWKRHALWFFIMYIGYIFVGVVSVFTIRVDWISLLTLLTLVSTPLILVYRSYDSLRFTSGEQDE